MEKIARRSFCGTALMAFPLMGLYADTQECDNCTDPLDPLMDLLAGEFTRTTADGARNGFKGEHYRQYASQIRILDARMESKDLNAEFNRKLDEDNFHQFNPARAAKMVADYWKRHGIIFDENDLAARLAISRTDYNKMKRALKKQGGIRRLYASMAESLERRARSQGSDVLRGGPEVRNGRIFFLPPASPPRPSKLMTVQYELSEYGFPEYGILQDDLLFGLGFLFDLDCLCRAMSTAGAFLTFFCIAGVVEFCPFAATLLAMAKLLEDLRLCDPRRC